MLLILRLCIAVAFFWAMTVALTGGVRWRLGPLLVQSRDPARALIIATALVCVYAVRFRANLLDEIALVRHLLHRLSPWIAIAGAMASIAIAIRWGTFAASGADSYGYVSQAYLWADGRLRIEQPIAATLPWPSADAALAPLGYVRAPLGHAIVPSYSPGLPILMALAARLAGPCGPFLIAPIMSGLLVWLTFLAGYRLGTPVCGAIAAILVGASPIVLFESMWPMSDLPVAALWMAVLISLTGSCAGSVLVGGILAAVALLVRPNLLLIPSAIGACLLLDVINDRRRPWSLIAFGLPISLSVLTIAILNAFWYGSPMRSGYGGLSELYHVSSLPANLKGFSLALLRSQTPLVFLVLLTAFGWLPAQSGPTIPRHIRLLITSFLATVWLSYIFYIHFPEWWYLRFLLPAIPLMVLLAVVAARRLTLFLAQPWDTLVFVTTTAFVVTSQLSFARHESVFGGAQAAEGRYIDIAHYVDRMLPPNAAILSMQHSGSLRFYAGRLTVRYDWFEPPWLARAPQDLEAAGYHPFAVIEDWETADVRGRLGLEPGAPLPWTIVARMREPVGVTVYDARPATGPPVKPVALSASGTRECERARNLHR
jgi:hypothetical protein